MEALVIAIVILHWVQVFLYIYFTWGLCLGIAHGRSYWGNISTLCEPFVDFHDNILPWLPFLSL